MTMHEPSLDLPALARWEPSDLPVVTCYVDWRVGGAGQHVARTSIVHGLREAGRELPARGPARESFDADAERIGRYLEDEAEAWARGLAIYACHGGGLWRTHALGTAPATAAHVGERPLLVPLAEAMQDVPPALIAVVDARAARLIELDVHGSREVSGADHAGTRARHPAAGGWGQANAQRQRDVEVRRFAEEAAAAIATEMRAAGAVRLIVGGDAVIAGPLLHALPHDVRDRVAEVEHIDIRASLDDVVERVGGDLLAAARADRTRTATEIVERAEGEVGATADPHRVQEQLSAGLVSTLALDLDTVEASAAELLLQEALTHGADVVLVRAHERLAASGGLAAALR